MIPSISKGGYLLTGSKGDPSGRTLFPGIISAIMSATGIIQGT